MAGQLRRVVIRMTFGGLIQHLSRPVFFRLHGRGALATVNFRQQGAYPVVPYPDIDLHSLLMWPVIEKNAGYVSLILK